MELPFDDLDGLMWSCAKVSDSEILAAAEAYYKRFHEWPNTASIRKQGLQSEYILEAEHCKIRVIPGYLVSNYAIWVTVSHEGVIS